jgi:ketosteroid isomerase-like protein
MKFVRLLMVLMCAAGLLVRARAQEDASSATKSKIAALEQAWNQAYKSADAKALDAILDDAILLVNDDGTMQTKAAFLASMKTTGPQTGSQEQQVVPESMTVRVFGGTAIASGVLRVKGIEGGKPYVRRERFIDTWVDKGGRWICVATDATPILH